MNRRTFIAALGAAGIVRPAASRPNIVYILCDDLGWGDPGCYNPQTLIPMIHANRLAREGMRFTDMHSPSSVCTPTRYGILTGRYCWRSRLKRGVLSGYSPNLIEPGRLTVPALLKKAGYATAGIGKWHLGLGTDQKVDYAKRHKPSPIDHGFDYYFGIPASLDMDPYVYIENDRTLEQPTSTTPGQNEPRGVFWRPGPIAPSLKIDEVLPDLEKKAVSWLRGRATTPDQPFFLYLPLTGPHTPWVPTPEYRGKSGAGAYGDFAVQTDAVLGSVLKVLDETGLAANTIVFFTSDNGAHWTPADKNQFPHRANANLRGMKADIWEAGHRVPFLVRWPGRIKPGSVNDDIACLTDLMATAAAITDQRLQLDAGEDSFSLLPAFTGGRMKRDHVIHHSSEGVFAIREGDWKLATAKGSGGFSDPKSLPGTGQLYNLKDDPAEAADLWDKHPKVVLHLTKRLERIQRRGRSRPL